MATPEQVAAARAELVQRWDAEGYCTSCLWHAALYEHNVDDDDLSEAIDNGGRLHLACRNYEYGDPIGHRGVTVVLTVTR